MEPLPQELLQSLDGEFDFLGPEIPTSIATAIAEGNLDPLTMEAFDRFPNSGFHMKPIIIQTSDRFQRPETTVAPKQESCFTILLSHETTEERITVTKQKQDLEDKKYFNEAVALEKIVFPSEKCGKVENTTTIPDNVSLKVPNNNPFKKRKWDEVVQLDQNESNTEQVSEVTEVEKPNIFSGISESQESVDSKPKILSDGKQRSKNEKKLKRSSCKSLENKKSSILNFFSRV